MWEDLREFEAQVVLRFVQGHGVSRAQQENQTRNASDKETRGLPVDS